MKRTVSAFVLAGVIVLGAGEARAQSGGSLQVNLPVSGVFTPYLPIDETGKPFVDYHFVVQAPGTYQIDFVSTDTSALDPYLVLLQNGVRIATDDDGGGALQARLTRSLAPGYYVVRCTRFGSGPVYRPVSFTLSATAAIMAPPPPPPTYYAPLQEALARVMATQFYNTRSEWAGQYAITIAATRIVQTGPASAEMHARYHYACIRPRCGGARAGIDQRVFYYQLVGTQWQVVRMGGHMSGSL